MAHSTEQTGYFLPLEKTVSKEADAVLAKPMLSSIMKARFRSERRKEYNRPLA